MSDRTSGVYPTGQHPSSPGDPPPRRPGRDTREQLVELASRVSRLERDSAGHSSDGRDLRDDIGQLRTEVAVIGSDVRGIVVKLGAAGSNARDVLRTVAAVAGALISITALILSIALTR